MDFAKAEEAICDKWAEEGTFKTQDKLGKERGDEVRPFSIVVVGFKCGIWMMQHEMDAGATDQTRVDCAVFLYLHMVVMSFCMQICRNDPSNVGTVAWSLEEKS